MASRPKPRNGGGAEATEAWQAGQVPSSPLILLPRSLWLTPSCVVLLTPCTLPAATPLNPWHPVSRSLRTTAPAASCACTPAPTTPWPSPPSSSSWPQRSPTGTSSAACPAGGGVGGGGRRRVSCVLHVELEGRAELGMALGRRGPANGGALAGGQEQSLPLLPAGTFFANVAHMPRSKRPFRCRRRAWAEAFVVA